MALQGATGVLHLGSLINEATTSFSMPEARAASTSLGRAFLDVLDRCQLVPIGEADGGLEWRDHCRASSPAR